MEKTFYKLIPKEKIDYIERDFFVIHSNEIENIYVDCLGAHKEGDKIEHEEFHIDHAKALDYVIQNHSAPPSKRDLIMLHKMLCTRIAPDIAGNIRTEPGFLQSDGIFVAGNPLPEYVEPLLDNLCSRWNRESTLDGLLRNHYELMTIHPFIDGNGRTGRLLLNWQSLRKLGCLVSIVPRERSEYYKEIRSYREEFIKANPDVKFTTYGSLSPQKKKQLEMERKRIERERKKTQKRIMDILSKS
jgi:Fic family protein